LEGSSHWSLTMSPEALNLVAALAYLLGALLPYILHKP
jgi:hypothetical protein